MTAVVAILGWAFNMSSRLSVLESRHQDLMKFIESKFEDLEEGVSYRLERIEHKLWNGGSR